MSHRAKNKFNLFILPFKAAWSGPCTSPDPILFCSSLTGRLSASQRLPYVSKGPLLFLSLPGKPFPSLFSCLLLTLHASTHKLHPKLKQRQPFSYVSVSYSKSSWPSKTSHCLRTQEDFRDNIEFLLLLFKYCGYSNCQLVRGDTLRGEFDARCQKLETCIAGLEHHAGSSLGHTQATWELYTACQRETIPAVHTELPDPCQCGQGLSDSFTRLPSPWIDVMDRVQSEWRPHLAFLLASSSAYQWKKFNNAELPF